MGLEEAEHTFALTLQLQPRASHDGTRSVLRNTLTRVRLARDTNDAAEALHSQEARRRAAQEHRASLAADHGAGSVVGQATAAELLFPRPLPVCDRWGDVVALGYADDIVDLETHAVLGNGGRSTLPHAMHVDVASERTGPHATVNTQLRSMRLPVRTQQQELEEALKSSLKMRATTYTQAVAAGVAVLPGHDVTDAADEAAEQADGERVWPPLALREDALATAVSALVDAIPARLDDCGVPVVPMSPLGPAGANAYRAACAHALGKAAEPRHRRALLELGVCLHAREPRAMPALQRQALHAAVCAHRGGRTDLARSLERLSMAIVRCG